MLSIQERRRNNKLRKALREQAKRHEKDPVEARRFLMLLGYWNEDGTLKEEWGGKPSTVPNGER